MLAIEPNARPGAVVARGVDCTTQTIASSVVAGWRSLTLRRDSNIGACDPYDTPDTPDQTLTVVLSGRCELSILDGKQWRSARRTQGSFGMTPGGTSSRLRWSSCGVDQPFETAHLFVPQRFFHDAREFYRSAATTMTDEPMKGLAFEDAMAFGVVEALVRAVDAGAPDLYAETAAQFLAVHLLSQTAEWHDRIHDGREDDRLTDDRFARVLDFMKSRLKDPPSLEELAAEAGVSKFYFARLFKARMGETPIGYLTRLRMEHAHHLLVATDLPIAAVAVDCGYKHMSHFDTAFRRWKNCTPSMMRTR